MAHQTIVTCPICRSTACRKSRWQPDEKASAPHGCRPYRCHGCKHRFFGPDHGRRGRHIVSAFATLALAILIGTILAIDWPGVEDLPATSFEPPPVQVDPRTLRAAQEGDGEAQFRLAKALLLDAAHDRANSAEAVRWLQSSAENNTPGAMVQLGKLYRSGFGVLQDYGQAAKWIRTAATLGDAEGMLELGRLYRDGVGFPRDPVIAYVWFNRAAAAQHLEAVREREDVARGLSAEQLKEAQAKSALVEADTAMAEAAERRED